MDGTVAEAPEEMEKEEVAVKMSGYLEKRGKFRLVATWKRYWFVLEGRLLLYYGSEQDYINLSACRGSINMGLVSCVRPGSGRGSKQHEGFTIEVVTRTQLIVLKMKERSVQEQWLQALLDSTGGSTQGQMLAGSGTLHFRYSMDALPTATKDEPSVEEKQSTLPRPKHDKSKTRQQNIIRHIKMIGGKSYVGSLDTMLKIRNNVYGSENQDDVPGNNILNGHPEHESQNNNKISEKTEVPANSSSEALNCIKKTELPQTLGENAHTQYHDGLLASDTNSHDQQADVLTHSSAGFVDTVEEQEVIKSYSHTAVSKETQVVNNQSYDGDYTSEDDGFKVETEGKIIENKLYNQRNGLSYEVVRSNNNLNTLCAQNNELKGSSMTDLDKLEKEEQYDHVTTKLPIHSEDKHNSFTSNEEVYYSCYDKVSFMEQLKNEPLDPAEPELPPRPHMSPEPNGKRTGSTSAVMEDGYAEYYTLDDAAPPLSPSVHSTTSSVEDSVNNKETKKKRGARRKKKLSESDSADENTTNVKRKVSFLHRLIEKYHKKKSKHQNGNDMDSLEDNNGAEYAVIDYDAIQSGISKGNVLKKKKQLKIYDDEDTHSKHAADLCSGKSLLPNNTFQELQQRLRQRTSPNTIGEDNEEELDYEAEYAVYTATPEEHDSSNIASAAHRKPVPLPRKNVGKSTEELTDDLDSGRAQQISNTPPKLPPRRMIRPRSPWHDVPSNNSPVYGNCEELFGTGHRDSLLGTPEGYAMVRNKWQAAETSDGTRTKGTQWTRELRQVTFPSRLGQRVLQWQEEASIDPALSCCSHSDEKQCCQHTISTTAEKISPETVNVDLSANTTAFTWNITSTAELTPPTHTPPTSLGESDIKNSSVSNNCNKITLVATVHSEDSLQSYDVHDRMPEEFKIVNHGKTMQGNSRDSIGMSECKEEANANTSSESSTMNVLEAVSDTQLSKDDLGECLNIETLPQFVTKYDTPTGVVPVNIATNIQEIKKPVVPEKRTYEHKSMNDITLKNLHTSMKKNVEKIHSTNICTLTNGNIHENIDPDSLMSDSTSQHSLSLSDKQVQGQCNELLMHEPNWNVCKCLSVVGCKNCAKKEKNKSFPDSHSLAEWNGTVHDSLKNFEDVELRKHSVVTESLSVAHTGATDEAMCPTCSLKAVSVTETVFDGTKAIQCIRYNDDGCVTDRQVVPVTKRYSDELNLLLAQLAEITSAPLLSPGVTISLVDFPEKRKHPGQVQNSEFDEWAAIGPIRRRRHSDPDYDVPRPHRSLLQLLLSGAEKEKLDSDKIEATKFFGKTDPCVIPRPNSSVGNGHEVSWAEQLQSETCSINMRSNKNLAKSQTDAPCVSITPDSLELEQP